MCIRDRCKRKRLKACGSCINSNRVYSPLALWRAVGAAFDTPPAVPVSYTHLRAHETLSDL
eukprot:3449153-Karenia_brevis.AAC.1